MKRGKSNIFVRDTLFSRKLKLEQAGETPITISDSVFPKANLSYLMEVKVLHSDNEYKTFNKKIEFFDHLTEITYELRKDSVLFMLKENGKIERSKASISGIDRYGYSSLGRSIVLPWGEKINPYFQSYKIVAGKITRTIHIGDGLSSIACESLVVNDSLQIKIINPRNLPFTWFLYSANRLERKGYGTGFSYNESGIL